MRLLPTTMVAVSILLLVGSATAQVSFVAPVERPPQSPAPSLAPPPLSRAPIRQAGLVTLALATAPRETVDKLPAPTLDLSDLLQLAMQQNPALAAAAARVEAAQGRAWQAGLYPNPVAGYSGEEMGDDQTVGKQGGFVSQRFVTAGKLRLDQAVANQQVAAAEQDWAGWKQRVETDVHLGYHDVLIAQRRLEVTSQLAELAESTVQTATKLVEAQETTRVDVLQARVEADSNRIRQRKAQNEHIAAWRQLAAVLGSPNMSPQRLVGNVDSARRDIAWESARVRLLNESPEIAVAHARLQESRLALERAYAGRIPDVDVQARVHKDHTTGDTVSGVEIGIPLPLFNRNQGEIAKASAEVVAAEQDIRQIEMELQRRLAVVYRQYANASFEVDKYVRDIRPNAKESLDLASQAYEAGEASYLTLLTTQRMYFQTDLAYVESLHVLWRASLEIDGLLLTTSESE